MSARLYPTPGYPFALDVTVGYALGADGLVVTTTTTDDLDQSLVAAATTWQVTPGHLQRVAAG